MVAYVVALLHVNGTILRRGERTRRRNSGFKSIDRRGLNAYETGGGSIHRRIHWSAPFGDDSTTQRHYCISATVTGTRSSKSWFSPAIAHSIA